MRLKTKIFMAGLLIYAASFFLPSVGGFVNVVGAPVHRPTGFECAFLAFIGPLEEARQKLLYGHPFIFSDFEYFSLLIAGWINLVFLISAFLDLSGLYPRVLAPLKVALALMIPFCWIFFYLKHLHPLAGHFLWIIGMVVVIFFAENSGKNTPAFSS